MIGIREATKADRDAILALRKRCFPDEDLHKQDPAHWDDEFANGRMFVAEDGNRIVAHLGFIPRTYAIGDGTLAVDAMTDPDFRRQGLFDRVAAFSVQAIRNDFRFSTAWQIRKAVLPAMVRNGWVPCAIAPVFARPLRLKSGAPAGPDAGPRLSSTRRTTLKGFDTLALMDVPSRAALNDAIACAKRLRVQLIAALLTLRHPAVPLVLSKGFLPTPYRFRLLVNSFDSSFDPRRVKWALSWKDTDHF